MRHACDIHVTTCRLFESTDTSGDQKLDYDEFVTILKKMDRNLKNLPATAQVASQQVNKTTTEKPPTKDSLKGQFRVKPPLKEG